MEEERCSNGSSNRLQLQHWHGTHDQLYLHNTTNPQDSEAHGQDASSSLSLLMRPNIIRTPLMREKRQSHQAAAEEAANFFTLAAAHNGKVLLQGRAGTHLGGMIRLKSTEA
jgi:hypothetical protein